MEQTVKSKINWNLIQIRAVYLLFGLWIFTGFSFLFLFSNGTGMSYVLDLSDQILSKKDANHPIRYMPLIFAIWTLAMPVVWFGCMLLYGKLWSKITARYS